MIDRCCRCFFINRFRSDEKKRALVCSGWRLKALGGGSCWTKSFGCWSGFTRSLFRSTSLWWRRSQATDGLDSRLLRREAPLYLLIYYFPRTHTHTLKGTRVCTRAHTHTHTYTDSLLLCSICSQNHYLSLHHSLTLFLSSSYSPFVSLSFSLSLTLSLSLTHSTPICLLLYVFLSTEYFISLNHSLFTHSLVFFSFSLSQFYYTFVWHTRPQAYNHTNTHSHSHSHFHFHLHAHSHLCTKSPRSLFWADSEISFVLASITLIKEKTSVVSNEKRGTKKP